MQEEETIAILKRGIGGSEAGRVWHQECSLGGKPVVFHACETIESTSSLHC